MLPRKQSRPTPHSTLAPDQARLEKVLAHDGLASRREAKRLIVGKKVSVNGTIVTEPGFGVKKNDKIEILGHTEKESVLLYKPRGIETTTTAPLSRDIHAEFPQLRHLSPVGRLDKESEGLIILTNDGTLTKALTGVDASVGKTYRVTVRENIPDSSLLKMNRGIMIDKTMTKPAITKRLSRTSLAITLYEGRNHQIRRMCDACHLTIVSLVRIGIGHLEVETLKPGMMRKLRSIDVDSLKG